MGQKAKNAGKKQSKTCNKLATCKSVSYTGGRPRVLEVETIYSLIDNEGIEHEIIVGKQTRKGSGKCAEDAYKP